MTSSTEKAELRDLREQFQMQEDLLGHLKGVLKSNEDKLQMKDLEVEGYAMRLGKVRSRRSPGPPSASDSRSSFGSLTGLTMDTQSESALEVFHKNSSTPNPMSDSYTTGVSNRMGTSSKGALEQTPIRSESGTLGQLRQQFNEIKAQEDEEQKSRKMLEGLVKQLQEELTERDNVIKDMREEAMSVASFAYTASPFVMSPDGGRSPTTLSPSRSPPLGCSVDSASSFDFTAGAFSFDEKDNKILDLKEQAILLERRILDLEENLREKDELIKARTQAVTLMSADLSAKGKSTLDQLEDTRHEMRNMQARFAEQEIAWKETNSTLEVELEAKTKRLQVAEESSDRIEKARFELSTRNAALQQKIVTLQAEFADAKIETREELVKAEENEKQMLTKIIQLEKSLEKEEKLRNDRKSQFIEELKNVVDDSDLQEKIVDLEHKITELEEEKGNLQLRLVDLEDLSVLDENLKEDLKDCVNKLRKKDDELDNNLRVLTKLETEKLDMVEVVREKDSEISKITGQISELLHNNEELSRARVKLEIRVVELEEQKDRWDEEKTELKQYNEHIKEEYKVQSDALKDIELERNKLKSDIEDLNKIQTEHNLNLKYHDQEMVGKAEKIREQGIARAELEKLLQVKADEIGNLLTNLQTNKDDMKVVKDELEELRGQNIQITEENERLNAILNQTESHSQLILARERVKEIECNNNDLKQEKEVLNDKLSEALIEKDELKTVLLENEHKITEGIEAVSALNSIKLDLERQIDNLKCDKQSLEEQILGISEEVKTLKTMFKSEKDTLESKISEGAQQLLDAEATKKEIEQKYEDQTVLLCDIRAKLDDLQDQNVRYIKDLDNMQIQLNDSESKLHESRQNFDEAEAVISKLREDCKSLEATNIALQSKLDANYAELLEKNKSTLLLEEANAQCEINLSSMKTKVEKLTLDSANFEDSNSSIIESYGAKILELENVIVQKESEISSLKIEICELEDEKQNDCVEKVETSVEAKELESTINLKEAKIDELGTALEQLKLEYESLKSQKERVISETEIEINACMTTIEGNEETIKTLQNDLKLEQEMRQTDVSDLKEQIEITKNEKEDLINQVQTEKKNSLMLQQNYDQLLSTSEVNDSTKEFITERDKAIKKSNLLTEKCKKLITKCKQQENHIKETEANLSATIQDLEIQLEKSKDDLNCKTLLMTEIELTQKKLEEDRFQGLAEIEKVKGECLQLKNEKNELVEKWQNEIMEKDSKIKEKDMENQQLESLLENQDNKSTIEGLKSILSEMQERIDFLEEAFEAQGNEKTKAEQKVDKLKAKLVTLTTERTDLYGAQVSLKDELMELKKENSRISAALEDSKGELGKIRQNTIINQMLDSPLLKTVSEEQQIVTQSLAVHDDYSEKVKNEHSVDTSSHEQDQGEKNEQEDSFLGFDDNNANFSGWDDDQIDIDNLVPETEIVDQQPHDMPNRTSDVGIDDCSNDEKPTKIDEVCEDNDGDGWGGWDDEELDLGVNFEITTDKEQKENTTIGDDNVTIEAKESHAMLSLPSQQLLSHEEPPASLISNVSGWGDDDGFGWGNEDQLPGNLRLSAERELDEVPQNLKSDFLSNKDTMDQLPEADEAQLTATTESLKGNVKFIHYAHRSGLI